MSGASSTPSSPRGAAEQQLSEARAWLERMFPADACDRLARSEHAYYSTHGQYVPHLATLVNETRAERDALAAEIERLRRELDAWRETCQVLEDGTGAELLAAERDELAAENERLREALAYYAEKRNYRLAAGDGFCKEHGDTVCAMEHRDAYDGEGPGARARAALGDGER